MVNDKVMRGYSGEIKDGEEALADASKGKRYRKSLAERHGTSMGHLAGEPQVKNQEQAIGTHSNRVAIQKRKIDGERRRLHVPTVYSSSEKQMNMNTATTEPKKPKAAAKKAPKKVEKTIKKKATGKTPSKKPRSAAQKAATKKMLAANKRARAGLRKSSKPKKAPVKAKKSKKGKKGKTSSYRIDDKTGKATGYGLRKNGKLRVGFRYNKGGRIVKSRK